MQAHQCRVIECPECWNAEEPKRQKGNFDTRERGDPCGKFRESSSAATLQSNSNRVGWLDRGKETIQNDSLIPNAQLPKLPPGPFRFTKGSPLGSAHEHKGCRFRVRERFERDS